MSDQNFNEEELFSDTNIPESNWFKFEKVGDKVGGVLAENPTVKKDPTGTYGDQRVFKLIQKDGSIINVGMKLDKSYIIERTNNVRRGDWVGFMFEKEVPPSKPGYRPAKSIVPFVRLTPEGDAERQAEKDFQ